jgi:hypothetical protein
MIFDQMGVFGRSFRNQRFFFVCGKHFFFIVLPVKYYAISCHSNLLYRVILVHQGFAIFPAISYTFVIFFSATADFAFGYVPVFD